MAHLCIKYRLTPQGTIPSFLCTEPNSVGGMYPVLDPLIPAPRDYVLVGLSETEDVGDSEIVPTQADLQIYLESVCSPWMQPSEDDPQTFIPFDPVAAAQWVWDRKNALDSD